MSVNHGLIHFTPFNVLCFCSGFEILESVPGSHKFKHGKPHSPDNPKAFMAAVRKEVCPAALFVCLYIHLYVKPYSAICLD